MVENTFWQTSWFRPEGEKNVSRDVEKLEWTLKVCTLSNDKLIQEFYPTLISDF